MGALSFVVYIIYQSIRVENHRFTDFSMMFNPWNPAIFPINHYIR